MRSLSIKYVPISLILLAGALSSPAMTFNLARPYASDYAPPRSKDVAFAFPKKFDAVFKNADEAVVEVFSPAQKFGSAKWVLRENMGREVILQGNAEQKMDAGFQIRLPAEDLKPGFYDLEVVLQGEGKDGLAASTTIGWRVDESKPDDTTPKGFAAFWQDVAAKVRAQPPHVKVDKVQVLKGAEIDAYNRKRAGLPGNYDPAGARYNEVEVYRVIFDSPNGGRVHAWFTKPVGDGPFPALLVLPGAGNNARPAPVEHARHGWAAMDVQIHGFPVEHPYYPELPDNKPERLEDHEALDVYRNALMAVSALAELPGVDKDRLAACGGSQGGRLTVIVSALDSRIKAGVAAITHYADVGRISRLKSDLTSPVPAKPNFNDWFDVANFAPLVRCPMLLNVGLIDRISPASSVQSVFLRLGGNKEIVYLPNMGHDWSPAFDRYAWQWLNRKVGESWSHKSDAKNLP
jgi:cephalosporin-C deacetylase